MAESIEHVFIPRKKTAATQQPRTATALALTKTAGCATICTMLYTRRILILFLIVTFAAAFSLSAQTGSSFSRTQPENLEVWLMIVGPGPAIYSWWGHIGLVLTDTASGREYLYDYGNFDFEAENFIQNFAMGRLWFLMMRVPFSAYVPYTINLDRDIRVHRLNLPNDKKALLLQKLEHNFLPENRVYLYHHYDDNCSTRIRDLLDELVGGQLRAQTETASAYSLRQMSRHFADHSIAGYWIINFLLAGSNDQQATVWDEMFVPSYLENSVKDFRYLTSDGLAQPLIGESRILHDAGSYGTGGTVRPLRYNFFIFLFLAILLLPALLFYLKHWYRLFDWYRILLYTAAAIPGSVLCFMMFFSDHDVTYGNWNILLASPLLLAVIPLTIWKQRQKKPAGSLLRSAEFLAGPGFSGLQTALAGLALLLARLPFWHQDNVSVSLNFLALYLFFLITDWKRWQKSPRNPTAAATAAQARKA
ncbi:MAG: DUF4105 domain-containing protein [Spirochaetes bacterium]|nr:DUF4105 domain-containing protein [Spirochaetota bacterium]